jgi:pimeloyl-ACP methyl ester carboxylesterase
MQIRVNHVNLYYHKIGSGKPLILLHGNQEDHHIFDELALELKEYFTLYIIDSRNHGSSELTDEFNYDIMADDIIKLIQMLNIEKPALLGYSDGGITGLKIAMKEPSLLSHLIVCGANLDPKGFSKQTRNDLIKSYHEEKSPYVKMMIEEPQIKPKELEVISSKTLIIAGEYDVIKHKHTLLIHKHIITSSYVIMKGHDHYNYLVHQDILKKIVIDFIV